MSPTATAEILVQQPDAATFKRAMRYLAGAVTVITTGEGASRTGLTASSVSSFSADSPSILASVHRSSSSWQVLTRTRRFCVNVLGEGQQAVAEAFAGRGGLSGADRYLGARWESFPSGSQRLEGALVALDCELEEAIERHSHAILIGAIRDIALTGEAAPLLYWHGAYRRLTMETGDV